MPDGNDTIRDLLAGFNSMQAQLGLTPMSGQAGFSMPATPMPQIKSPGELSQELMQASTRQMETTMRATQQTRMAPGPGVLGLSPVNIPDIGRPPPPANAAAGQYAAQYQERMQDIESRYLQPHQAQQYARTSGQPGFMNMPSPVFQTAPSMGIFRPNITAPPPIHLAREAPMVTTPFTPQLPTPRFQTRTEMSYHQRALEDERMFAGTMAALPTAANVMAGGATAGIAAGVGGRIGQAIGGARGAAIGRIGGLVGGGMLGFGVLGGLAERGMERGVVEPIMRRRAMGRQLERMSENFVVGGPDLNQETGRGLTTRAAVRLAGGMQRDVEAGQTGGFNMRDMMRISGMAAQGGMLDMAQSGEQIRQQVRNVARGLQSFMQIAQEPDVRKAMQQMSAMRSMGLTIPETNVAMRNAQTFARMAGTTVQGLQEQAGMPGAMTFQQLGMTAGLGMQVGHAAAGLSRQAIAGGAFTPGQLAMAGGQSGLTQTMTEAGAAGLGVNFPLLAMLERGGPGGQLSINKERAGQIMRGELTLSQQAQMGAQNIQDLGGESAITELSTRLNELRDELGRTLGPQGTTMLAMRQATNLMGEVPGLSFGAALRQLGMSPQQARSVEIMGQSPQFWQNVREQHEVNIRQLRDDESSRRERMRETSELSNRVGRWWNQRGWLDRPGEMISGAGQAISEWWTDRGARQEAAGRGASFVGRSRGLEVEGRRQQEAINRFVRSGGQERFSQRFQSELSGIDRGAMPTTGEALGGLWNTALGVGTAVASVYGGPLGGMAASAVSSQIGSNAPSESRYVAALQARGGITGKLAGWMPGLAMAAGTSNPWEAARADYEANQSAQTGNMMRRAERLSGAQRTRLDKELQTAHKEYARALNVDTGKTASVDMEGKMVRAAISAFQDNSSMWGDKATMTSTLKKKVIEARVEAGEDRALAERYVNDMWDRGLGASVLRQAQDQAPEDAKASIAKTLDATGYKGMVAGKNLEEIQSRLEDIEDKAKEQMGFYKGFDATEEAWNEFSRMATMNDENTMLVMQAQALEQEGKTEEAEKIYAGLIGQMGGGEKGKKALQKIRRTLGKRVQAMTDDQRDMLRRAGTQLAKLSPEERQAKMREITDTLKGTRGTAQIAKGAARMTEQGMGAFGAMMRGGVGEEGAMATLQELVESPGQLDDLAKKSPAMAKVVREFKEAGDDPKKRQQAARKLLYLTQQAGRGKTGGTFGGRGIGGTAEEREREQMGIEAEIEESIKKGKPGEAFAKSVPTFSKATGELREATKDLKDTVQAARLLFKMPGTG